MANVLTLQPLLRRCDVVDGDFAVVMRGPSPDQLRPASGGETLEPEFGREVAAVIALHDFRKHPIATALVGTEYGLRIARLPGPSGAYYSVTIERIALARPLRAAAAQYRLSAPEQELLRLLVGGYDDREIAKRLESSRTALQGRAATLCGKLGCARRGDLARIVFATPSPEDATLRRRA